MTFRLREVPIPTLGATPDYRDLHASVYERRIDRLLACMQTESFDAVVVYGDREHLGNIAYLSGFDPRFEEALLVVLRDGSRSLLVGNEGLGYSAVAPRLFRPILCQSLSLLGQSRSAAPRLDQCLLDAGIASGQRIAAVGWKYFLAAETDSPSTTLDLPSWIADCLRQIVGHAQVLNGTPLLMHPASGLRTRLEAEQILAFDPACHAASVGVARAILSLRPGMSETEVAASFGYDGRPLNYHPIVTSADRVALGLASPSSRRISHGDPVFMAMGGWGANTVRGGYAIEATEPLPPHLNDYIDGVVTPYMEMARRWYEAVAVGVRAGEVVDHAMSGLGGRVTGVALNPGHHIHLDEWVSSPFEAASEVELTSGMMLQMDIIPVVEKAGFGTNAEDGVVLADAALRETLERMSPEFWARSMRRRAFIEQEIGIALNESVLPMSEIQGWLTPFLLSPHMAMSRV